MSPNIAPTPPEPAPRKSWPRRHPIWTVTGGLLSLLIAGGIASAVAAPAPSGGTHRAAPAPTVPDSATTQAPPAPPVANPDGTYRGSCDYILGGDPVGGFGPGTAKVIGEIDLKNTGNVGLIMHTRITWPQEGAAPIVARKTVKLPYGAHKVVRFKVPINGDQVDLLQSWQERHGFRDGCTYRAEMTTTYGPVQS